MSDVIIEIPPALSAVVIELPDGSTLNPTAPTVTPPVVVQPPGLLGPMGPQGIAGPVGPKGEKGDPGSGGEGSSLPAGGTVGQTIVNTAPGVGAWGDASANIPRLTRLATNQMTTVRRNLAVNPLPEMTFEPGAVSWSAASSVISGGPDRDAVWAFKGLLTQLTVSTDIKLLADGNGLRHAGIFLSSVVDSGFTGLRVAALVQAGVSRWIVSTFTGGTGTQIASATVPDLMFVVGTARRVAVTMDYVTGDGSLTVDGTPVVTWNDKTFTSGRPGGFWYQCSPEWSNMDTTVRLAPRVDNLPLGASLYSPPNPDRDSAYLVSVIDPDGAVLAQAVMKMGDVWEYPLSPSP